MAAATKPEPPAATRAQHKQEDNEQPIVPVGRGVRRVEGGDVNKCFNFGRVTRTKLYVRLLPELVKVEGQVHAAPDAAAVFVPRADVVLGLSVDFECTIFIGTRLQSK